MKSSYKFCCVAVALLTSCILLSPGISLATVYTWNAAGADTNWTTPGNWTNNSSYPQFSTDTAIITGTTGSNINLNTGITLGTLIFTNNSVNFSITNTSSTITIAAGGIIRDYNGPSSYRNSTINCPITLAGDATFGSDANGNNGGGYLIIARPITGSGTITMNNGNSGRVSLNADSTATFSGLIVVPKGIVIFTGTGGLGDTNTPTILSGGGFQNVPNTLEPIIVVSNSFIEHWGSGTFSSQITISNAVLTLNNGGNTPNYNGYFAGTNGSIVLSGGGGYQFSGSQTNVFTGPVTNPGCAFNLNKTAIDGAISGPLVNYGIVTLSRDNQISDTAPVTLRSSGILRLNGYNDTIGSLSTTSSTAVAENNSATIQSTLTISNSTDCSFYGTIRDGNLAKFIITKGSTGTFFMNGPAINSGTWMIRNGTLGGTGPFAGAINVEAGGNLAPGLTNGVAGTITLNNNLTNNSGSTLTFDLGYTNLIGSGMNDLITVSGNVSLSGSLNVSNLTGYATGHKGDKWRLINYSGTISGSGLTVGTVPSSPYILGVDTNTAGQVNLVILSNGILPGTPSSPTPTNNAINVAESSALDWADALDADGYNVYLWKSSGSKPGTPTSEVTQSQYTPPVALDLDTTYNWQIVATNSGSLTATGTVWSFKTRSSLAPLAPDTPSPANNTTDVIVSSILGWQSFDATSYDIYLWSLPGSQPATPTATVSTNSYNPGGLAYTNTYNWFVVASNSYGTATGEVWAFTARNQRPFAPYSPSPTNGATNASAAPVFTWSCTDAETYDIYLWLPSQTKPETPTMQTLEIPSFYAGYLTDLTNYFWQVVAVNAYGSETGEVWTFSIPRETTAINFIWNGGGGTANWDTPANWVNNNDFPRLPIDTATFTGSTLPTVNLNGDRTVKSIIFSNTTMTFSLQGNTLSIADGGTIIVKNTASQNNHTISSAISMLGSMAVTNEKSGNTLTISGEISGSGMLTLDGTGASTITVSGNNTGFLGTAICTNLALGFGHANAFGTNTTPVEIRGTVSTAQPPNSSKPLRVAGTFSVSWGYTYSGSIELTNNGTVNFTTGGGNACTINSAISGTGNIFLERNIRLSGTAANTFTGMTTFVYDSYTIQLNKPAGLDAIPGPMVVGGTTYGAIVQWANSNQVNDSTTAYLFNSNSTCYGGLRLSGFSDTIGGLVTTGGATGAYAYVENTHTINSSTLTLSNNTDCIYAGIFRNGNTGMLNVVKSGTGMFCMNGIATNTGTFTVSGGTLGGTGLISGTVLVTNDASINPGNGVGLAGTLIISNNLTLAEGTALTYELAAPLNRNPGATNDMIAAVKDLVFNGNKVNITSLPGFETSLAGDYWTLIQYSGSLSGTPPVKGTTPANSRPCRVTTDTPGEIRLVVLVSGTLISIR